MALFLIKSLLNCGKINGILSSFQNANCIFAADLEVWLGHGFTLVIITGHLLLDKFECIDHAFSLTCVNHFVFQVFLILVENASTVKQLNLLNRLLPYRRCACCVVLRWVHPFSFQRLFLTIASDWAPIFLFSFRSWWLFPCGTKFYNWIGREYFKVWVQTIVDLQSFGRAWNVPACVLPISLFRLFEVVAHFHTLNATFLLFLITVDAVVTGMIRSHGHADRQRAGAVELVDQWR